MLREGYLLPIGCLARQRLHRSRTKTLEANLVARAAVKCQVKLASDAMHRSDMSERALTAVALACGLISIACCSASVNQTAQHSFESVDIAAAAAAAGAMPEDSKELEGLLHWAIGGVQLGCARAMHGRTAELWPQRAVGTRHLSQA